MSHFTAPTQKTFKALKNNLLIKPKITFTSWWNCSILTCLCPHPVSHLWAWCFPALMPHFSGALFARSSACERFHKWGPSARTGPAGRLPWLHSRPWFSGIHLPLEHPCSGTPPLCERVLSSQARALRSKAKACRGLGCRAAAWMLQEGTRAGPDCSGCGWTEHVAEGSVGHVPPPSTGSSLRSSSFPAPLPTCLRFSSPSCLCSFFSAPGCGE